MKTAIHVVILLALSALFAVLPARAADAGTGLITELGDANGIALACKQAANMSAIKSLMINTVPKTRANGELFEHATSESFLRQGSAACPSSDALSARVTELEARLKAQFKQGS
ncbi:hypothetical protein [Denitromonas iodatirespirans]|uniref:Uncharacterized protein n=1 Tax=Denitromonas iodatirespirans TaxID=2795389 RepID=A0A944HDH0_DENI1|nr:hypothetical protein [Denitromonas iodatirespirans]MBT0963727.1 hypothetical protein [Denitromonas iodatirespirans]